MAASLPTLDEIRAAVREEIERALADIRKDDELISMAEAARRLGVSSRTVQRWVKSGELASVAVGHTRRVRVADLAPEHPSTLRPAG